MTDNLKLRPEPPKAVLLNRWLVIMIVLVLMLFLIYIMLNPTNSQHALASHTTDVSGEASTNTTIMTKLPKDYSQSDLVQKYLPDSSDAQLARLQAEQDRLMAELTALKSNHRPMVDSDNNGARKSDLFFYDSKPSAALFKTDEINKSLANSMPNNSYNQQNMQSQKVGFVNDLTADGDVYNKYHLIKPASPYEVMAGTIISSVLITAINTSLPGDVIAQVKNDVYDSVDGEYLLIPKGSKLLGKYDSAIAYGQERVLIVFNRIIRPDGSSIQLSNFTGSDISGTTGFEANIDNHWGKVLGAATISTLLSVGAGVASDRNTGTNPYYPSAEQGAILGAANGINQVGSTISSRANDIQPTLTVPAGFYFNVIVNKDMVLEPYAANAW